MIFHRFNEKMTIVVNGKRKRITKLDAVIRVALQNALKSPADALRLMAWALQHEPEFPIANSDHKITIEFVNPDPSSDLPGPEDDRPDARAKRLAKSVRKTNADQS
jgi:hypothetical protein